MRLRQSGGGGEITPYLRERERDWLGGKGHVNYFTVGCVGIGAFITGWSVMFFTGVVLDVQMAVAIGISGKATA